MDGFFQQQEENRRLHKRCDELQNELREMKARLLFEHEEFERRIEAASSENLTLDHVLVGFKESGDQRAPVFVHKDANQDVICASLLDYNKVCYLIIESIICFKNFKAFNTAMWGSPNFRFIYRGDIFQMMYSNQHCLEMWIQNKGFKSVYKAFKELGIKFLVNGFDSINGVPIDKILS